MSSEIAKHAESTGAQSGAVLTRRRSQARNSSLSSRNAAKPAQKNRSRCDGPSCAQAVRVARNRSTRGGISRAFESVQQKTKARKQKTGILSRGAVARFPRFMTCPKVPSKRVGWVFEAAAGSALIWLNTHFRLPTQNISDTGQKAHLMARGSFSQAQRSSRWLKLTSSPSAKCSISCEATMSRRKRRICSAPNNLRRRTKNCGV